MGFMHLGLDGTLLKEAVTTEVCCSSCLALSHSNLVSLSSMMSLIHCKICMVSLSVVVSAANLSC